MALIGIQVTHLPQEVPVDIEGSVFDIVLSGDVSKVPIGNGLVLHDNCLPICQKLKKDVLLIEHKTDLDRWRFKDKNVSRFINDFHNGQGGYVGKR